MRLLAKLRHTSSGSTLVEVLVYVALLTGVLGSIGAGIFHALQVQPTIIDDGLAVQELRRGLAWFADDVKMARDAVLTESNTVVTLSWVDYFEDAGTPHTVEYRVMNGALVRTHNGTASQVARRANSVTFTIVNRSVSAEVQVQADGTSTKTLSVKAVMKAVTP